MPVLNDCEEYPFGWLASTVNVHSRSLYLSLSLTLARSYGECISDLTLNQVDSATACRNPRRTKTEYRHHPVASPYDTPPYWVRYAHTDRQDTHKQIAAPTRVQVITFTRTRRPPPHPTDSITVCMATRKSRPHDRNCASRGRVNVEKKKKNAYRSAAT